MGQRIILVAGITLLLSFFCFGVAFCDEKKAVDDNFNSIEALIDLLREKGIVSEEEAARFIQRSRKGAVPEAGQQRVITIIPVEREKECLKKITKDVAREIKKDVQKQVKEEIKDEIAEEMKLKRRIPSTAEWTQRIRWGGDIRLRYQGDFYDEKNADLAKPDKPYERMNTREDRHRARIRVRLAMKAEVNDQLEVGVRISTGNETNPVSTNETLGDYKTSDNVVLERAYLKWKPIPEISLWGGRIPNPWFCSDLVWDSDLNFEGVALNLDTHIAGPLSGFLTAGAFPLQEEEWSQKDKWLFGGQAGLKLSMLKDLKSRAPGVLAKIGVAYYDYENTVGERNDPRRPPNEKDWTAPQFQQKGNTLFDIDHSSGYKLALASEYDELNVTGMLDIGFFRPVHVVFLADYVKNLGFDRDEVVRRTGNPDVKEEIEGYQVGLTVGHPRVRRFGAWNTFLFRKYLEADAVLDAFTDSDFHLGGTNAEGWILGAQLGLRENWWLRTRWLTADEVEGPPLAIDVLQVDMNAAF